MNKNFLILHGEKGKEWENIIGTNRIPVTAPILTLIIDREGKKREAYMMDYNAMDQVTQRKIVDHLAEKFSSSPIDVEKAIIADGLPILIDDCEWTLESDDLLRYVL